MGTKNQTTLGALISCLYEEFLAAYGDEDMAAVAVAATVNKWLAEGKVGIGPRNVHQFGAHEEAAA